jgi:hypothetical protein
LSRPDLVNGVFEIVGSLAIWGNVRALYLDKMVRGSRWYMMVFFTSWGYWNMFYYPHLNQWLSFAGGCSLAIANTVWTALAAYYVTRRRS